MEVPAGRLLHLRVRGDPPDARRRRHSAQRRTVTVHEGIDLARVDAAPPAELHKELWLPHDAPDRRQRRGARAAQGPEVSDRRGARLLRRRCPTPAFVIAGEGELQAALEHQIKHHHLEKHVILAGFRPDMLSLHKAFDIFVMSSVTEGLGTSLLDAMACAQAGGRDQRRRDSRSRRRRRDGVPGAAPRSRGAGRGDRAAALGPRRCARRWAPPASRACASASARSTWCGTRSRSTSGSRAPHVQLASSRSVSHGQVHSLLTQRSARASDDFYRSARIRGDTRLLARAIVEGNRRAVLRERDPSRHPRRRIAVARHQIDLSGRLVRLALRRAAAAGR